MHSAAYFGDDDRFESLLSDGQMTVDDRNAKGWTPLHFAAMKGAPAQSSLDVASLLRLLHPSRQAT